MSILCTLGFIARVNVKPYCPYVAYYHQFEFTFVEIECVLERVPEALLPGSGLCLGFELFWA